MITNDLRSKIFLEIENLIYNGFNIFYFGGFGDFDNLCWEITTELKNRHKHIKRIFCLVDSRRLSKKHLPRKELERCVVSTLLEVDDLKKDRELKAKDNEYLFKEISKLEKQMPELTENKQYFDFIKKYAGNELKEVYSIAKFRQNEMSKPKFKTNEKYFSK